MIGAWLEYDNNTGQIQRVTWKKTSEYAISISSELAENFINGKEKFSNWTVVKSDVPAKIIKKPQAGWTDNTKKFWNLQDLNSVIDIPLIIVEKDNITLTPAIMRQKGIIYMTFKNDPSWLLESWDITMLHANNQFKIQIESAHNYSYYLG